eukprot:gene11413-15296_t
MISRLSIVAFKSGCIPRFAARLINPVSKFVFNTRQISITSIKMREILDSFGNKVDESGKRIWPDEYYAAREAAAKHAGLRGKYFDEAKAAFESGKKKEAKELSEEVKNQGVLLEQANARAVEVILKQQNLDSSESIDLHGLYVAEAVEAAKQFILKSASKKDSIEIITGAGLHSANGPLIKPAILKLCEENKWRLKKKDNDGSFILYFSSGGISRATKTTQVQVVSSLYFQTTVSSQAFQDPLPHIKKLFKTLTEIAPFNISIISPNKFEVFIATDLIPQATERLMSYTSENYFLPSPASLSEKDLERRAEAYNRSHLLLIRRACLKSFPLALQLQLLDQASNSLSKLNRLHQCLMTKAIQLDRAWLTSSHLPVPTSSNQSQIISATAKALASEKLAEMTAKAVRISRLIGSRRLSSRVT